MSNEIIDVSEQKIVTTLYKSEQETLNYQTGEVVTSQSNRLTKEKKRERFIKVFIDNMDYIIGHLNKMEKDALWLVMQEMNYYNIIKIDSGFRKSLQVGLSMSQGSSSKVINSLIDKKVLLKVPEEKSSDYKINIYTGKEYLVNPQLVGQGSFKELTKMRRTITTSFDFDKLEATQEIKTDTAYSELSDVINNADNHEVKHISQYESSDKKHFETEVIVGEKTKNKDDLIEAEIFNEPANNKNNIEIPLSNKEIELAIINAENKKLELQLELKKLDILEKQQTHKETK